MTTHITTNSGPLNDQIIFIWKASMQLSDPFKISKEASGFPFRQSTQPSSHNEEPQSVHPRTGAQFRVSVLIRTDRDERHHCNAGLVGI